MKALVCLLSMLMFIFAMNCSKNSPTDPIGKNEMREDKSASLVKKLAPITDIDLIDDRFDVSVFYSMGATGGLAPLTNSKLLAIKEWGENVGVYKVKKGASYNINDAFTTLGAPFQSPDYLLIGPDGTVYISDNGPHIIFRVPKDGGAPVPFVTRETTGSEWFDPYQMVIAPPGFDGPNVDPGDLIVCDSGMGTNQKAVWAVNLSTGVAKIIATSYEAFDDGPINCAFNSEGTLYIYENFYMFGHSRIVILHADGTTTPFLLNTHSACGFAIHPITDDIYFRNLEGSLNLCRIKKSGGTPELFAANIGNFQEIAFNADGTILFIGASDREQIIQISAAKNVWEGN